MLNCFTMHLLQLKVGAHCFQFLKLNKGTFDKAILSLSKFKTCTLQVFPTYTVWCAGEPGSKSLLNQIFKFFLKNLKVTHFSFFREKLERWKEEKRYVVHTSPALKVFYMPSMFSAIFSNNLLVVPYLKMDLKKSK